MPKESCRINRNLCEYQPRLSPCAREAAPLRPVRAAASKEPSHCNSGRQGLAGAADLVIRGQHCRRRVCAPFPKARSFCGLRSRPFVFPRPNHRFVCGGPFRTPAPAPASPPFCSHGRKAGFPGQTISYSRTSPRKFPPAVYCTTSPYSTESKLKCRCPVSTAFTSVCCFR